MVIPNLRPTLRTWLQTKTTTTRFTLLSYFCVPVIILCLYVFAVLLYFLSLSFSFESLLFFSCSFCFVSVFLFFVSLWYCGVSLLVLRISEVFCVFLFLCCRFKVLSCLFWLAVARYDGHDGTYDIVWNMSSTLNTSWIFSCKKQHFSFAVISKTIHSQEGYSGSSDIRKQINLSTLGLRLTE